MDGERPGVPAPAPRPPAPPSSPLTTWIVSVRWRRTKKQDLPLPRTVATRERTRTVVPASAADRSAMRRHTRPVLAWEATRGASPYRSARGSAAAASASAAALRSAAAAASARWEEREEVG